MGETLGDIDLVNPDNYVERVPFEWFDHLREEHPVIWHPEPAPNRGFWAVTRYDDLTAVHMDWETYSSEVGAVAIEGAHVFTSSEIRAALPFKPGAPWEARQAEDGRRAIERLYATRGYHGATVRVETRRDDATDQPDRGARRPHTGRSIYRPSCD